MDKELMQVNEMRKQWSANDIMRDAGILPAEVRTEYNIPYAPGRLTDFFYPLEVSEIYPVIVNVHGGGWFYGSKQLYSLYAKHLAHEGFAVVNFNYRLAPENRYPAAFEDVCLLMDYLRKNREEFRLDLSRIHIVGDSAGAQLATQYCIYAANPAYRKFFPQLDGLSEPLMPRKAALNCGVYDVNEKTDRMIVNWYLGGETPESIMHMLDYMNSDFPETFLTVSVNDGLCSRSDIMREKLGALGIKHIFREYGLDDPKDGHVFHLNFRSLAGMRMNEEQLQFFRE
jgi:acetyl esterase/lipase